MYYALHSDREMSEDGKKPPPRESQGSRKKRRRRRKPRRKKGSGADQKEARGSNESGPARDTQASTGETPWTKQRQEAEQKRQQKIDRKRQAEEAREVDPREVYAERPVLLALETDVEEEFLDDLVEPEWDPEKQWVRTVQVLSPFMRARQRAAAEDHFLQVGDEVILSTPRGIELGTVLQTPRWEHARDELKSKVLRTAGYSDSRQMSRNEGKCLEAFDLCQKHVALKKLRMKLLRVEYLHGGGKAVFYFTAEKRVDFRQLIRDLAAELHIRIEMRQVGVRDAARLVGGVGPCGEQVCCNRFLERFTPVSIKMAKVQSLMLNPQKVSGVCGRLLCCLEYEYEQYRQMLKEAPRVGKTVRTPHGEARVKELMLLDRRCVCEMKDGSKKVCPWEDLEFEKRAPQQASPKEGGKKKRSKRRKGPSQEDSSQEGADQEADGPAQPGKDTAQESSDDQ